VVEATPLNKYARQKWESFPQVRRKKIRNL